MPETTPQSTSATRNSPFFQSLQREMNELFDRFRGTDVTKPGEFFEAIAGPAFPAIDVAETDDAVEITAEVPGVSEDDLDVTISQNMLILKGEKSSEHKQDKEDMHIVERRYGSFRRQIPLGFMPADGAVAASFANGVLKLKIDKPEDAKNNIQKVSISRS